MTTLELVLELEILTVTPHIIKFIRGNQMSIPTLSMVQSCGRTPLQSDLFFIFLSIAVFY